MPVFSAATIEHIETSSSKNTAGYLNTSDLKPGTPARITLLGCDGEEEGSLRYYEIWAESLTERRQDGTMVRKPFRFAKPPSQEQLVGILDDSGFTQTTSKFGKPEILKEGYAYWIWNYEQECVQILQTTIKGINQGIALCFKDEEVAKHPSKWDVDLLKTVDSTGTKYTTSLRPGKRANKAVDAQVQAAFEAVMDKGGNLSALLSGGNPFGDDKVPF